jgi:excisionase family DNA binding protein
MGNPNGSPGLLIENLVTKKQLARDLGISQSFISKLMQEEGLPHYKLGRAVRYNTEEIAQWLSRRKKP